MSISLAEQQDIRNRSAKPMLWLAIISMCMIFGGLTSAYVVRSGDPGWMHFDIPFQFTVSTLIIIASSITMFWATESAKKDNPSGVKTGAALTLLFGARLISRDVTTT